MALVEVYDLECLINLFTYTGYSRTEDKWYQFVIHKSNNQYLDLIKHLKRGQMVMVGFNNLSYDYPLLHHLLNHFEEYKHLDGYELTNKLYKKSQEIISMDFSEIAAKNMFIPQIDVYKVNHWDNPARSCSLKHCELAMGMDNIEEMPLHHSHWITKQEEIDLILNYNKHDVRATNMVFDYTLGKCNHPVYKGKNKMQLRQLLSKTYKMNLLNHSDVKMGEDILLKLYSNSVGVPEYMIKKLRTYRKVINLGECIPSYINFNTPVFINLKNKWSSTSVYSTNNALKDSIIYHGIKLEYGLGGVHGSNSGIFEEDDYWMIMDSDVGSLYPSIGVQNEYYPEHLGRTFLGLYAGLVNTRLSEKEKPKKERNPVIMEGYKLFVNGAYGKSNSETSFLYDPLYTMKTTITGQLSLTMLMEMLTSNIPEIEWIQANTDGITCRLPRKDKQSYLDICSEWERITKLMLEHAEYKKMIVRDVSNYIAVYTYGDVKLKGCFEIDKELHKDPSMKIVPIALKEYFVNGTPIEETIKNHTNILDFCMELKVNRDWHSVYKYINSEGNMDKKELGRITRYYISGKSGVLEKHHNTDGRITGVNIGFGVEILNKIENKSIKDFKINYHFYSTEARKIINKIETGQMTLF